MSAVRVRFAPSPTGPLHIGGVRTALFNYLFAKKQNGTFVLRIEDTDQKRYVPGAEDYILEALQWSGILPDEGPHKPGKFGPYRQSERKDIYPTYVQQLIDNGWAYYAFDTPEELEQLRAQAEQNGTTFSYNFQSRENLNNSLKLTDEEVKQKMANGEPYVLRFKIPAHETVVMQDMIRGKVSVETHTLDDKVLMKADGMPTYHLANIVDDHLMQISHVIRGEEWLPSMALHVLLYKAFGWEAPKFAHLPLILKPEGKGKLSKRDGDKHGFPVFPLEWKTEESTAMGYREQGYLPQAFINMLALLGWNPGTDQEIFELDELVQKFDLNKVSKSGARFNPDKAVWFNHQYLQKLNTTELGQLFQKLLTEKGVSLNAAYDQKVVSVLKERANFVQDLWQLGKFFYQAPTSYDEKGLKKAWKEDSAQLLEKYTLGLNELTNFEAETVHAFTQSFVKEKEIGFGKIMMPLRLCLVGSLQGPDVPVIMEMLGKEEVISRIENIIQHAD